MKANWSGFGLVDGRGKINGHVASRNRGGAYIRTKVSPLNPQSIAQMAARARLVVPSQGWRALSQAVRDAWDAATGDFARTDVFGNLRNPSGKNLYSQLNVNLANAGQAAITNPPQPAGAGAVIAGALVITNGGAKTIAHTGDTAGHTIIVRATPGVSPGRSFVKQDYRIISTFTGGTASPEDIATAYEAKFGEPAVGTKVFVSLQSINNLTGESSTISAASTLVV